MLNATVRRASGRLVSTKFGSELPKLPTGVGEVALKLFAARRFPAEEKSGLHFCFDAPSRKSVAAFHAGALGAGGSDNGKPGLRADYGPNYYAAFVVDPDGYRLEAYCDAEA